MPFICALADYEGYLRSMTMGEDYFSVPEDGNGAQKVLDTTWLSDINREAGSSTFSSTADLSENTNKLGDQAYVQTSANQEIAAPVEKWKSNLGYGVN